MSSPGAVPIIDGDEVFIGDTYFPIVGPVRRLNISVPPNPVAFGDVSRRSDNMAMSEQIQTSNTGGSGTYLAEARVDIDVNWTSEAETRYRHAVMLPPETVSMGAPGGETNDIIFSVEYRSVQYFFFANKVYTWQDSSDSWSVLEYTLPGVPTDVVVWNDRLWVAFGSGYSMRDSSGTWTNTIGTAATLFVVWDARLWRLAQEVGVYRLYAMTSVAMTWSVSALGEIASYITPSQMLVYRDPAGLTAIYLVTTTGLWMYDADSARFHETEITYPATPNKPRATTFADGKLYLAVGGMGLFAIQSGSQFVVSPIGLDMKDGVPSDEAGYISALSKDQNFVLALTTSLVSSTEQEIQGGVFDPLTFRQWPITSGKTILRAYGSGWHRLWTAPSVGSTGAVLVSSNAYAKPRIYFASNKQAYYQDIELGLFNPRQVATRPNAPGPVSHITPWFDFSTPTQDKLHGRLITECRGMSDTETIEVYYGTDKSETWTYVDTITTNGRHDYMLTGPTGLQAKFFRYRFVLQRGSDPYTSPILEYYSAQFMRILPETPGFAVNITTAARHRDKSPSQLVAALERLQDSKLTPNFVKFAYKDHLDGTTRTYYARITRFSGQEWTGQDNRGKGMYMTSLIVPYNEDSIIG